MSISIDGFLREISEMQDRLKAYSVENARLLGDLEDTKAQLRRTETPEYTVQVRKLEAENKRLLSDLCVERNQRKNAETFLGLAQKAIIGKNETIKMLSAERNKLREDLANAQAQLRAKDQHQDRLLDPGHHVIRVRVGDQMVNVREVMEEVKTLREALAKQSAQHHNDLRELAKDAVTKFNSWKEVNDKLQKEITDLKELRDTTVVSYDGNLTTVEDLVTTLKALKDLIAQYEVRLAEERKRYAALRETATMLDDKLKKRAHIRDCQLANATKRAVRQQQYIDRLRLAITELQRVVIAGLPHSKYPKNPV